MAITALQTDSPDDFDLEGSGLPGVGIFARAVQVWSMAQDRPTTVEEAALAFNVRPELIVQAVEHHGWMSIIDGVIEHEGE